MGNACSCTKLTYQQILSKQDHLEKHMNAITSAQQRHIYCNQLTSLKINEAIALYRQLYLPKYTSNDSSHVTLENEDQIIIKNQNGMLNAKLKTVSSEVNYKPLQDQSIVLENANFSEQLKREYFEVGRQAIKNSELAVFILHGKTDNNINYDKPIGTYDIGLDSACTVFEILISKLKTLSKICLSGDQTRKIKLYILTNSLNKKEIIDYFKKKSYFGYGCENIFFFSQETLPVMEKEGRIMLKSKTQIMTAPLGNGAVLWELFNKNILQHLEVHGAKYIYMGPIHNVLMNIGDPKVLGHLIRTKKQIVCTAINKSSLKQHKTHFGFFGTSNSGKIKIYENLEEVPESSEYINTGSCVMSLNFIKRILKTTKFQLYFQKNRHIVQRIQKCYMPQEQIFKNQVCIFFQLYYHDILEFTNKVGIIEVEAEKQFCPMKNADGVYSPKCARQTIWNLHRIWATKAGYELQGLGHIQFAPQLSYQGENIIQYIKNKEGEKKFIQLPRYCS